MYRFASPSLCALTVALFALLVALLAIPSATNARTLAPGAARVTLKAGACAKTSEVSIQARAGRISASGSASGPMQAQLKCTPGRAQSPKGAFVGAWAFNATAAATDDRTLRCHLVVCNSSATKIAVSLSVFRVAS